ncbi:MAG: carbohydrate kinase family protein [Phycisphaeraceae bacterium]|nr:carbohydrate kinase family protein [Phycisphaeraceae bacterium]
MPSTSSPSHDAIVAGTCVLDMLCRPVRLDEPIGRGVLHDVQPMTVSAGGNTANTGIAMARLGLKIGLFTYVGNDAWGPVIRRIFEAEHVDTAPLLVHPTAATSTTVVAIDPTGERSFLHCPGAPGRLDKKAFLDRLDLFSKARWFYLGYYALLPTLEPDMPAVFAAVRKTGCKTALDAAGSGGTMQPLDKILPHLDLYVPSLNEATHQTSLTDPEKIIARFRGCGAPGLLGVKLGGTRGVLLSPAPNDFIHVDSCTPPGPVVDTTGAGDCFYAGLLTGLIKGLPIPQAGRLGTAAAACCVTALGGNAGARDFQTTAQIAGL